MDGGGWWWCGRNRAVGCVVDLMVEKGLTGRDVAAVFAHTPRVSVARVRGVDGVDEKGGGDGSFGEYDG